MPLFVCPKFNECHYNEFIGVLIGQQGSQIFCPTHNIPLIEQSMKKSGFSVSGGGMEISKEGIMKSDNAKLSVTGNVRNKGEMRLEYTDVKIEGDLENEGVITMNEMKVITQIIQAINDKQNVDLINKQLAELYQQTKSKGIWQKISDHITKNVKWRIQIDLIGFIPHVHFDMGSKE